MQLKKGKMPDGTRKSGVHKHCECNGKQLETCVVENSEKENHGFTGVSGSGKSSLCLDTIAAESRRELNVTFPSFVQRFCRNMVVRRLSAWRIFRVTIVIDQKKPDANSRNQRSAHTPISMRCCACSSHVWANRLSAIRTGFSFNHPERQV